MEKRKGAREFARKSLNTLVAFFLLCAAMAAQTSYTLTDIGRLNDLNDIAAGAASINNAGAVAGQKVLPSGPDRAFLWIRGTLFDLGTFGGDESASHAINNAGQVVGAADTSDGIEHAFFWDGTLHDLGTLGGPHSEANRINARGAVVGFADTTIPDPTFTTGLTESHAFVWTGGGLTDLGTLGGPNSIAIGVNNRGQIVGWSQIDFNIGAFGIPDLHAATWTKGVPAALPGLGGAITLAIAVNDAGIAVGQSFVADNSTLHAVLWQSGNVRDLGTLPGDFGSSAAGINSRGQVVGMSFSDAFAHAFIWQNGVMTDLNTFIPPDSGWMLMIANYVNDMGQIVGNGLLNGELHAFLLTPSLGGGRTGTRIPPQVSTSGSTRHALIWGKTGLLKHNGGQFKPAW